MQFTKTDILVTDYERIYWPKKILSTFATQVQQLFLKINSFKFGWQSHCFIGEIVGGVSY